jgi:hypothetical protein
MTKINIGLMGVKLFKLSLAQKTTRTKQKAQPRKKSQEMKA